MKARTRMRKAKALKGKNIMAKIDIEIVGNGVATVSNYDPVNGEVVILDCVPDSGETLLDIEAWDSGGHSIALDVQLTQSFTWTDAYVTMSIKVTFSRPKIHITIIGDGTAWVSNDNPNTGEIVTLNIEPALHRRIRYVYAWDENGNPIQLTRKKIQTFVWNYQFMEIEITFDYKIQEKHMPIWMYPYYQQI